jgi:hypothetical protein
MKRALAVIFVILGVAVVSFAASERAFAQSPFSLFDRLFGPRWTPDDRNERRDEPREKEDPTVGTVYNSAAAADADVRRPEKPQEYVVVIGDTMADQLSQGLAEAFFGEHQEIAVIKKVRASSGLVRSDFFDWFKEAENIVKNERASAFVVMIGSNDRQALRDKNNSHEIRSDQWRELYAKRVDDFLAKLKEKNTPIYVVGMPPVSAARANADMQYLNEIFRERAARAEVRFVEVWEGFIDEQGQFATSGAAMDGQIRRLRISDGVHFTRTGARKLAFYVERDLLRLFESRVRSPYLPYGVDLDAIKSGVRPAIGPAIPLTIPVGQGRVLEGEQRNASTPNFLDDSTKKTLVDGVPPAPVDGRADDFRWPRR